MFESYDPIPISKWGPDHWSLLVYVWQVSSQVGGFQVGTDSHLRTNPTHHKLLQASPLPLRPEVMPPFSAKSLRYAPPISDVKTTRVPDTSFHVPKFHDDWSCVKDIATEGLLEQGVADIVPGAMLTLSPMGLSLAMAAWMYERKNENYRGFSLCNQQPNKKPKSHSFAW